MKVKVIVPESLDDIKLKDFQKFAKVESENPDSPDFIKLKMLQYFCGLKVTDVRNIRTSDVEEMVADIQNSFAGDHKLIRRHEYKGTEFGFIPDLENMSFGEYIDLNTYLSDIDTYHKAMAVLYRPITLKSKGTYLIEEYESSDKYADLMKELPVSLFIGAQVFFYNLGKDLVTGILNSLDQETLTSSGLEKILEESGGGIPQFMLLLEGTYGGLMQSLN
jgi:hypothetical protein